MHTVTVDIGGARYRLTTDSDEAHVRHLASLVNARIDALGSRAARSVAPAQLLAIVALGLAEELEAARKQRDGLDGHVTSTLDTCLARLERALAQLEVDPVHPEVSGARSSSRPSARPSAPPSPESPAAPPSARGNDASSASGNAPTIPVGALSLESILRGDDVDAS